MDGSNFIYCNMLSLPKQTKNVMFIQSNIWRTRLKKSMLKWKGTSLKKQPIILEMFLSIKL
jgi:hypothetical protein